MWKLLILVVLQLLHLTKCDSFQDDLSGNSASSDYVMKMEHSFDNGRSFSSRGSLTIHSMRSGAASTESGQLRDDELRSLQKLCDEDGLYLVRLISTGEVASYRSATHACNLLKSELTDIFTVQLDWRHKVVSVYLSTPNENFVKRQVQGDDVINTFKTKVYVQHMESGPAPDTASFIQKIEQDKLAKERGETKDNRSFLAKYWMYIIPVVLVLAMSGGGDGGGR